MKILLQKIGTHLKVHVKNVIEISKTAFKKWYAKDPFRESAVIAYYAIFSLPGLLVVVVTLAAYFFGREAVSTHISDQITSTLGEETAAQIVAMINKASQLGANFWATIFGIVTILAGATGVFAQFQKSLNAIWQVKADEAKSGLWSLIRVRLFSFGLIVSIAFILMVSLVISALLSAFGTWLTAHFSNSFEILLQVFNFLISLAIMALLFSSMFKYFPDAIIKWRDVWIGSLFTAFLFEAGKFGLGLYFGKANPGIGYGPAGSVILILLWVSYTSMIVFYGAEFTRAFADVYTGKVVPTEISKKTTRAPQHKKKETKAIASKDS